MTTNANIAAEIQKLHADSRVELFEVDTGDLGLGIFRFTSTPGAVPEIVWQGNTYPYVPVETSGWEWNGQGQLPTPTMTIAVSGTGWGGLVVSGKDLLGARVKRTRTFYKFVDNGSAPDPTAFMPIDEFRIEQKTAFNKTYVSWSLSAVLDKQGIRVPRRIALKAACTHVYRRWNTTTASFDYTQATCPYTGGASFTADGAATASATDRCGKRVADCKLRFGDTSALPTRAFPGIVQFRT